MFMTKVKIAAIVLLGLGVLGAGAGVVAYQELGGQRPDPIGSQLAGTPAVPQEEPKNEELPKWLATSKEKAKVILDKSLLGDKLKKLLLARYEAAYDDFITRHRESLARRGTLDGVMAVSRRLLDAERELTTRRADQLAAYEAHSERMKQIYDVEGRRASHTNWVAKPTQTKQARSWVGCKAFGQVTSKRSILRFDEAVSMLRIWSIEKSLPWAHRPRGQVSYAKNKPRKTPGRACSPARLWAT